LRHWSRGPIGRDMIEKNVQTQFDITINHEIDGLLDTAMLAVVEDMATASPMLASMGKYHLGWLDRSGRAVDPSLIDRGKRVRPKVALLSCMAICGRVEPALQIAAAIELLHNFTLIHDDIQDASRLRRHRETVWSIWGTGQAINAGDALFAASHRLLLSAADHGLHPPTVLELVGAFDLMTIDIVGGQVMDLQFEDGLPASVDEYLQMIRRKTAAILEFAAWAGAIAGGAGESQVKQLGQFGEALGIGFQLRDDVLGVWGDTSQTGKAAADDLRRKKQSLPVVLLRESAAERERQQIAEIFANPSVTENDVKVLLTMLDEHQVREKSDALVQEYHDDAEQALDAIVPVSSQEAIDGLRSLTSALASRQH
jgi:geranylgeranyl diphosphate synthase, type I